MTNEWSLLVKYIARDLMNQLDDLIAAEIRRALAEGFRGWLVCRGRMRRDGDVLRADATFRRYADHEPEAPGENWIDLSAPMFDEAARAAAKETR